jgi:hypothetical protein
MIRNAVSLLAFSAALLGAAFAATACDDADDEPPMVRFEAGDSGLTGVPSTLRPGFTSFEIKVEEGDTSHSVVFLRANEGVSVAELIAAAEAEGGPDLEKVTAAGGATTTEPGETTTITLELSPGLYSVSDVPEGELVNSVTFEVTGEPNGAGAPESDTVIEMGPGMVFEVSDGFGGDRTVEVRNRDSGMHEAGFIRFGEGIDAATFLDWVEAGFNGPPPEFSFVGGVGPFDESGRGWTVTSFEPGAYAIICFVSDEAGPHFANGMLAEFSVK